MNGYGRGFLGLPPVVKNIIIINIIMLLAKYIAASVFQVDLVESLGLFFPKSEHFKPVQILTHMFMHADFWHLFFNMYALFIFGQVLENVWGPKRFLIYYLVCGLGAVIVHESVIAFEYHHLMNNYNPELVQILLNTPTIGASGAIFGVLLAFGVLFPNTQLMLLFPPIPIKAKYFVLGYGAIELYLAFSQPGSNIAHAAHLGGMLFGYLLIRYWRKTTKTLY
jgi:membrane associated rhomboid family serine protease